MCGRFTLLTLGQFTDLFPWIRMPAEPNIERRIEPLAARYNIAPSQPIAVVANDGANQIEFFRWGLVPFWAKDAAIGNRLINARMESLEEKPAFRAAFRSRRCLIPADGFYEWKRNPGAPKGSKIPMRIRMKSHQPFAFAGLWERWRAGDGGEVRTCTIITGAPNDVVRPIHDRMPVILRPADYRHWIEPGDHDAKDLLPLLATYPASEMEAYPVSTLVNSPATESAECVEPVEPLPLSNAEPGLFG
jgi:putative SOS response-associated peptidase YedK